MDRFARIFVDILARSRLLSSIGLSDPVVDPWRAIGEYPSVDVTGSITADQGADLASGRATGQHHQSHDSKYLSHQLPLAILGAPRHEASPARLLPAPRHLSPFSTHSIPPHSVPCARIRDRRNVAGDRKTCSLGARIRRCTIWVGSNNRLKMPIRVDSDWYQKIL
jgi:hypothetical protein